MAIKSLLIVSRWLLAKIFRVEWSCQRPKTRVLRTSHSHSYRCTSCQQSSSPVRQFDGLRVGCDPRELAPPPGRKGRSCRWPLCRRPAQLRRLDRSAERFALCRKLTATLPDAANICRCANLWLIPQPLGQYCHDTAPALIRTG